jgi:hypothetical protein
MSVLDASTAALAAGGLGLGTLLGTVVGKMIEGFTSRRKVEAEAAEVITDAAGTLVNNLQLLNRQLDAQLYQMRVAVLLLTEVVDQIAPLVNASQEVVDKLKSANRAAKLAYMGHDHEIDLSVEYPETRI